MVSLSEYKDFNYIIAFLFKVKVHFVVQIDRKKKLMF
jgi:hypothetical protein